MLWKRYQIRQSTRWSKAHNVMRSHIKRFKESFVKVINLRSTDLIARILCFNLSRRTTENHYLASQCWVWWWQSMMSLEGETCRLTGKDISPLACRIDSPDQTTLHRKVDQSCDKLNRMSAPVLRQSLSSQRAECLYVVRQYKRACLPHIWQSCVSLLASLKRRRFVSGMLKVGMLGHGKNADTC